MTNKFLSKLLMLTACLTVCLGFAFLLTPKKMPTSVLAEGNENKITQANLALTESLVFKYYATVNEALISENAAIAMRFTMNDTNGDPYTTVVKDFEKDGKQYVFALKEIAPQLIAEEIDATLVLLDETNEIVEELASYNDYSVKKYLLALLKEDPSDELKLLIHATLNYGAASQVYQGNENTITKGLTFDTTLPALEERSTNTTNQVNIPIYDKTQTQFVGMGVWFDYVIIPYVYAYIADEDLGTVKFQLSFKNTSFLINPILIEKGENGGIYRIDLNALNPIDFAKSQSVKLIISSTKQQIPVSLNDYCYDVYYGDNSEEKDRILALALYQYGAAAVAYKG